MSALTQSSTRAHARFSCVGEGAVTWFTIMYSVGRRDTGTDGAQFVLTCSAMACPAPSLHTHFAMGICRTKNKEAVVSDFRRA